MKEESVAGHMVCTLSSYIFVCIISSNRRKAPINTFGYTIAQFFMQFFRNLRQKHIFFQNIGVFILFVN